MFNRNLVLLLLLATGIMASEGCRKSPLLNSQKHKLAEGRITVSMPGIGGDVSRRPDSYGKGIREFSNSVTRRCTFSVEVHHHEDGPQITPEKQNSNRNRFKKRGVLPDLDTSGIDMRMRFSRAKAKVKQGGEYKILREEKPYTENGFEILEFKLKAKKKGYKRYEWRRYYFSQDGRTELTAIVEGMDKEVIEKGSARRFMDSIRIHN